MLPLSTKHSLIVSILLSVWTRKVKQRIRYFHNTLYLFRYLIGVIVARRSKHCSKLKIIQWLPIRFMYLLVFSISQTPVYSYKLILISIIYPLLIYLFWDLNVETDIDIGILAITAQNTKCNSEIFRTNRPLYNMLYQLIYFSYFFTECLSYTRLVL